MHIPQLLNNIDYWKEAPVWDEKGIQTQLKLGLRCYHD